MSGDVWFNVKSRRFGLQEDRYCLEDECNNVFSSLHEGKGGWVRNWHPLSLPPLPRFRVSVEMIRPERLEVTTTLKTLDYIDVPASAKKDHKLTFFSYKEGMFCAKVEIHLTKALSVVSLAPGEFLQERGPALFYSNKKLRVISVFKSCRFSFIRKLFIRPEWRGGESEAIDLTIRRAMACEALGAL